MMKDPVYTKSYLALGDSYTIGEAVPQSQSFPFQLVEKLNANSERFSTPTIIAKTGWTTGELISAIEKSELKPQYDLVTLLIGVNNQYRGYSIEEYKAEFDLLTRIALQRAGNKAENLIIISIPDWGVTPFALNDKRESAIISKEIDNFNDAAKAIAKKYQLRFLDITIHSRQAQTDPSLLADDGLHPSGKMYAEWVRKILEVLK